MMVIVDVFALKGPNMSAQGKATRVVRASPSPWECDRLCKSSPERAKQPTCPSASPFHGRAGDASLPDH